MDILRILKFSKLADENAIAFDDNNNNSTSSFDDDSNSTSTSLAKPESTLPDFSQDIIKVNSYGIM